MRTLFKNLNEVIKNIEEVEGLSLPPPLWEVPREIAHGDLSTMVALKISSKKKQDPFSIASAIKATIQSQMGDQISEAEVVKPGFINLFFSKKTLIESLNAILDKKDEFFQDNRPQKVILEFVSANPTGPLSIAHGRQAIVGDVLGRVLEFMGNKVTREYYINDLGRQIDLLVHSVDACRRELEGQHVEFPEDGYKGEYVKEIARQLQHIPYEELKGQILNCMLRSIRKDLTKLRIAYDTWFSQSSLIANKHVENALALLRKKGFLIEKESALWFNTSKFGDDKDRVLKKSDGELTYFASDIAYHKEKIERKPDKLINLWGPDHHGYIQRVKAAIDALGYNSSLLEVIIIQLVTIKSKERMSRRKGTALLLSDLIEEVGVDAARFYYLLRRNSSPLEFDIDLAKTVSLESPLYYIQYAHARITSIYRKADIKSFDVKMNQFIEEEEILLLREVLRFYVCLEKVYYSYEPVYIIEYLKNLAMRFHKYYESKKVIGSDRQKMRARLNVLESVRITLACGLKLLGITPLESM